MRVDEDFSGADAPRKYQADEVVHAIDRIPGPRDGQLIRLTGALRGGKDEPVPAGATAPAGHRAPGAACHDGGVNGPTTARVFRISRLGILAGITLALCATPVAISAWWLLPVYLIPVVAIVWVVRRRTEVDADSVTTKGLVRTRRVPWSDITSLRLRSSRTRSRVSAVLTDGTELPLPAVTVADLPLLAAASGGRVPDPTRSAVPPPSTPEKAPTGQPADAEQSSAEASKPASAKE